jgi:hypothetical protein
LNTGVTALRADGHLRCGPFQSDPTHLPGVLGCLRPGGEKPNLGARSAPFPN